MSNFVKYTDFYNFVFDDILTQQKAMGASYWIHYNTTTPTIGYLVGVFGVKIPRGVDWKTVSELLTAFWTVIENTEHLSIDVLGIWLDESWIYIDAVQHIFGLREAIASGIEYQQIAIFDLTNKEELIINGKIEYPTKEDSTPLRLI